MIKTAIKGLILVGLMGTSFYYGEKIKPIETITTKLKYYRIEAGKDTPNDYLNWKSKIEIENNKAILYFGNYKTNKWRKVHENGMVGSFGEKFDEYLKEKKTSIKNYFDDNNEENLFDKVQKKVNDVGESIGTTIFEWFN